jgi:hypothetical protein
MNVRLDPTSIRFRLSTEEFVRLRRDRCLRQSTVLTDGRAMVYALQCAPLAAEHRDKVLHLDVADEGSDYLFRLTISPTAEQRLDTPHPDKDGVTEYLSLATGSVLTVGLEIDIRKGSKTA